MVCTRLLRVDASNSATLEVLAFILTIIDLLQKRINAKVLCNIATRALELSTKVLRCNIVTAALEYSMEVQSNISTGGSELSTEVTAILLRHL